MDLPCSTCKHINTCSLDSDYQCSALFIFRQLNNKSVLGRYDMVSLGYNTKKAYKKNLQYVRAQFKKVR